MNSEPRVGKRPAKKSETVEIRLPHATKTAFMARCRADGRTASDVIRCFIEDELSWPAGARASIRTGWRPLVVAAVAGLALGAAAPSLAQSVASDLARDRATFARLDRDHDGAIRLDEFRAR